MKKSLIISFLLLILTVPVFIGCSDDETTTTIIAAAEAEGYLIGYAYTYANSDFEFYTDIFPMSNNDFKVDSIVIEDSVVEYRDDTYWNIYGDNNYQWAYYEVDSAYGPGYYPGDIAAIKFYNNNKVATLNLNLLDHNIPPTFISPVHEDTIALSEPLTITWNSVENAEYYGVYTRYYRDSAGVNQYRYDIFSVNDTSYTIPGSKNIYNGNYYIYVMAINGPDSSDAPNLNGADLKGRFHSYTTTSYIRQYVGTIQAATVSGEQDEPDIDNSNISRIIMDKISGHKLHKDNQ